MNMLTYNLARAPGDGKSRAPTMTDTFLNLRNNFFAPFPSNHWVMSQERQSRGPIDREISYGSSPPGPRIHSRRKWYHATSYGVQVSGPCIEQQHHLHHTASALKLMCHFKSQQSRKGVSCEHTGRGTGMGPQYLHI